MTEPGSGDVVVKIEPLRMFLTPYGFHRYAADFLTASRALLGENGRRPPSVKFFLLYKSIELSLKAFLLMRGFTAATLRRDKKFGHHVDTLYEVALTHGLRDLVVLSDEQETALYFGRDYYVDRQFDYFDVAETVTGFKGQPNAADLEDAADTLVGGLKQPCLDAVDQ